MDLKAEKVPYAIPVPNNMGMVRYVMAFSVLIAHFNSLGGASFYWPISSYNAVGGFFALSGFLMIGSWLRKPDFRRYFKSRCRRLLPAYWSVVLLFAVVLGLFSETPGYFLSSGFYEYLAANLSFLNFVHPGLPGVFTGMEVTAVNGSLWTMKVEWLLYLSLPCVAWFLVRFRRRPVLILGAVYLLSVAYRFLFLYLYNHSGREVYMILSRQFLGQMMFFYTGVFIYYYYGLFMRFRYVVLFLSSLLLFLSSQFYFLRIFIEPAAISSLVIWFSMVGRWATWCGRHDNISYNIYLVHFPVIQLSALFSLSAVVGAAGSFLMVCMVTVAISWAINHFVERPLQRRWRIKNC